MTAPKYERIEPADARVGDRVRWAGNGLCSGFVLMLIDAAALISRDDFYVVARRRNTLEVVRRPIPPPESVTAEMLAEALRRVTFGRSGSAVEARTILEKYDAERSPPEAAYPTSANTREFEKKSVGGGTIELIDQAAFGSTASVTTLTPAQKAALRPVRARIAAMEVTADSHYPGTDYNYGFQLGELRAFLSTFTEDDLK